MLEVKIKPEIESRCGIKCSHCEFQNTMNCKGCLNIQKPFWGEVCPVKKCSEDKSLNCCGECKEFPCDLLKSFAYDKKQGDDGERIKNCGRWCHNQKEKL